MKNKLIADYLNEDEFSDIIDKSVAEVMFELKDKRKAEDILKMCTWIVVYLKLNKG